MYIHMYSHTHSTRMYYFIQQGFITLKTNVILEISVVRIFPSAGGIPKMQATCLSYLQRSPPSIRKVVCSKPRGGRRV